jgi:hypothetical protein
MYHARLGRLLHDDNTGLRELHRRLLGNGDLLIQFWQGHRGITEYLLLIKLLGIHSSVPVDILIQSGEGNSNDYAELYELIKHWRVSRITFRAPDRNTVLDFHAWFRLAKTIGIFGMGSLFLPKSNEIIPLYAEPTMFELSNAEQCVAVHWLGVPTLLSDRIR